jgi:cytochrome P450
VTRDVEVSGCPMVKDERVLLMFGSANRDPTQFSHPDEVILDRHPNRHLGFGAGPHRCVGSHLARLMVEVALEELLPVLGDFSVADRSRLVWRGGQVRGLRCLPIVREQL